MNTTSESLRATQDNSEVTAYARVFMISTGMFGVAVCLVFAIILVITFRYRKSKKPLQSPELEHLLESSNNREDSRLTVTRYIPPESIYISEVKKSYETSSSHDLQQPLPNNVEQSSRQNNHDPNESGYQSDSIGFRTFEQAPLMTNS